MMALFMGDCSIVCFPIYFPQLFKCSTTWSPFKEIYRSRKLLQFFEEAEVPSHRGVLLVAGKMDRICDVGELNSKRLGN